MLCYWLKEKVLEMSTTNVTYSVYLFIIIYLLFTFQSAHSRLLREVTCQAVEIPEIVECSVVVYKKTKRPAIGFTVT